MLTQSTPTRDQLLAVCEHLAYSPFIPHLLESEIRKQGFAGSANIPKLVYLTLWTGMLRRPVSLLIKGPSGAGKSYSLRMGKQFVPANAYVEYEGMSDKALVYLPNLDLKHKHLIIGEAAGMAEGNGRSLLRQLLSEGKVNYATVQSTANGHKGEVRSALEGPCGLIMTTTATGIHHEDETRMISVNLQESPEQIMQALLAQASGSHDQVEQPDMTPWFALYEYVDEGPKKVVVPFATEIAKRLPTIHDRVKRDFPQIMSLIKASALMHSCTRFRESDGAIIANIDDYKLVYNLVNEPISEGIQVAVPEAERALVNAVKELEESKGLFDSNRGASQGELAEKLNRDQSSVSRQVFKALKDGYLVDLNPGQGKQSRLVLGNRELPSGSAMPKPEEVFA